MEAKLYDTQQLKRIVNDDKEIPLYIQEFVNHILDRDLGRLQHSYATKEVDMTKKMAYKLRFSLSMWRAQHPTRFDQDRRGAAGQREF